ncbi:hypothetical protein QQ73_03155 [Candidatus Endoriftia persephone str. Guaymas]|jgi:hypothetical protein|uniref:PilZ domain-containing protein n=3 Tax=Gammaproteobacteria TaxID=1236 RepID=G2FER8_9GAMM|nr:PilZ domain-containing protein [Candidatus Endoriftia persephone]EGV51641.1 hypothetical protein Rifp1Sym_bc00020 [endosymbiont of Riftia pachyptila (vent Ph05)]EGW54650.1 hypothetical protein TevJSym_aj00150 [endosymbiont of Tevnia jerichonana (vent Tica)]MBA1330207.1 hypothetical protein [Candidatus Endoriftia persephone str. Guaymas]USF88466.1 PilZ domain-containing protein [Candidatus Endoriftia persephone]
MYVKKPFEHSPQDNAAADDRRAIKRRHLIYYLRVWDSDSNALLGHVVDITTEGMMLVGEHSIPDGRSFDLEIRLPDRGGSGQLKSIHFKAVTRWSHNDVNRSFYDTGFYFEEPPGESIERVRALIAEYAFHD